MAAARTVDARTGAKATGEGRKTRRPEKRSAVRDNITRFVRCDLWRLINCDRKSVVLTGQHGRPSMLGCELTGWGLHFPAATACPVGTTTAKLRGSWMGL